MAAYGVHRHPRPRGPCSGWAEDCLSRRLVTCQFFENARAELDSTRQIQRNFNRRRVDFDVVAALHEFYDRFGRDRAAVFFFGGEIAANLLGQALPSLTIPGVPAMARTPTETAVAAEDGAPAVAELCELGEVDAGLVASKLPGLLPPALPSRHVFQSHKTELPTESPPGWSGVRRRGGYVVGTLDSPWCRRRVVPEHGCVRVVVVQLANDAEDDNAQHGRQGRPGRRKSTALTLESYALGPPRRPRDRRWRRRGDPPAAPGMRELWRLSSTFCRLAPWPRQRRSGSTPGRTRSFSS